MIFSVINSDRTGHIQYFSKGVGWYLTVRVVESMGHNHKMLHFKNWDLIESCYTKNSGNATKSRNYNYKIMVTDQSAWLFCYNIYNLFLLIYFLVI